MLILFIVSVVNGCLVSENFDDVSNLPGWVQVQNSNPVGPNSWFQGDTVYEVAQAGAPNAYIAADWGTTGINNTGVGNISLWLLTPEVPIYSGLEMSFWTVAYNGGYNDTLEVRFSTSGSSSNVGSTEFSVGDFYRTLLKITNNEYPLVWTYYVVKIPSGIGRITGRFAFRYFNTDAGPDGVNGYYIGIDTLCVGGRSKPELPKIDSVVLKPTRGSNQRSQNILAIKCANPYSLPSDKLMSYAFKEEFETLCRHNSGHGCKGSQICVGEYETCPGDTQTYHRNVDIVKLNHKSYVARCLLSKGDWEYVGCNGCYECVNESCNECRECGGMKGIFPDCSGCKPNHDFSDSYNCLRCNSTPANISISIFFLVLTVILSRKLILIFL